MQSMFAKLINQFTDRDYGKITRKKKPISFAIRPILEELEPRLLFSGGLEGVLLDNPEPAANLEFSDQPEPWSASAADTQDTGSSAGLDWNELVFIDTQVDNYQELLNDILAQRGDEDQLEVILLNGLQNGVDQIDQTLSK